jgi:hypothetical protein
MARSSDRAALQAISHYKLVLQRNLTEFIMLSTSTITS